MSKAPVNILVLNMKGGAGKTTTSHLLASFLSNSILYELDTINQTTVKLDTGGFYEAKQVDFKDSDSDDFIKFEQDLIDKDKTKNIIIDVGAPKLVDFVNAMTLSETWDMIDLLIIPAMDGKSDYDVAYEFLTKLHGARFLPPKILFAFNRFNAEEYDGDPEKQFTMFFKNAKKFEEFGIDLKKQYFTIGESMAIKIALENEKAMRIFADMDHLEIRKKARTLPRGEEQANLLRLQRIVLKAQKAVVASVAPMMAKIVEILGDEHELKIN